MPLRIFFGFLGVGVGHKARGLLAARPRIAQITPPVFGRWGFFLYVIFILFICFRSGGSSLVMVNAGLSPW